VHLCRACGVVAPLNTPACGLCRKPWSETRIQHPSSEVYWVAVRCSFTCNSCRFEAPLDALDTDGAVECAHCGLNQRFEVSSWAGALEGAHAIGDLSGPNAEGRSAHPVIWIGDDNPYRKIGDTEQLHALPAHGMLHVEACPGYPVCHTCHLPVEVRITGKGTVETGCRRCSERATYTLRDDALGLHEGMIAAIADEHRTDRPRARTQHTQTGVAAIACPGCGAPLSIVGPGRLQTCQFCKAACIIPSRSLMRARNEKPESDTWWILFQGPSKKRKELEAPPIDTPKQTAQSAKKLLVPGAKMDPIGDKPGVYEAPETPKTHWPQVGLTVAIGTVALAIGYLIAGR
jgi:hypothetical protein